MHSHHIEPVKGKGQGQNGRALFDSAVFARWQRDQQRKKEQGQESQPTVTVAEVFLGARRALQAWVDAERNKQLVLTGDMGATRRAVTLEGVLNAYQGYGPVMQEKLSKHLEFLVENRRKFYVAFGLTSSQPSGKSADPMQG